MRVQTHFDIISSQKQAKSNSRRTSRSPTPDMQESRLSQLPIAVILFQMSLFELAAARDAIPARYPPSPLRV